MLKKNTFIEILTCLFCKIKLLAFAILISLWSQFAVAQNIIGHYGNLVGQCQAIYDLGLMKDPEARLYSLKIFSAWEASDKRTIIEYKTQYNKTKNMLLERVKFFGQSDALSFAESMYPKYLEVLSANSGVVDTNNSGRKLIQKKEVERANETKAFNANQLSQRLKIPRKKQTDIVTIAHVGPLSGPIAHLGKDNENGARMAIDELNKDGLVIGGTKVTLKLISEDDASNPKQAVIVANKLLSSNVSGVIGHLNSGTTISASKIYFEAGIPQITPSATSPIYSRQGFGTAFRLIADDNALSASLARYASNFLKIKTVAVIDDRTTYGHSLALEFSKNIKNFGGNVIINLSTTNSETDFTSILNNIRLKNPDLIFFGGNDDIAKKIIGKMNNMNINTKFMSGDGICYADFAKSVKDVTIDDQVYCAEAGGVDNDSKISYENFIFNYKAKFNLDVQMSSPFAYDAVKVLVAAMVKAGTSDPNHFFPFLVATNNFKGITGDISFDDKGDNKNAKLTIKKFRNGQLVPLAVTQ
jgi:branched-chain amino acid transport system substrate-binding protein